MCIFPSLGDLWAEFRSTLGGRDLLKDSEGTGTGSTLDLIRNCEEIYITSNESDEELKQGEDLPNQSNTKGVQYSIYAVSQKPQSNLL